MRKPPCKGAMGLPSVHLSSRVGFALLFSRALLACECIRAPSLHPAPPCSRNILEPRNAALRKFSCDRTSGESTPTHGRAFVFLTAIGGGLAVEVSSRVSKGWLIIFIPSKSHQAFFYFFCLAKRNRSSHTMLSKFRASPALLNTFGKNF